MEYIDKLVILIFINDPSIYSYFIHKNERKNKKN